MNLSTEMILGGAICLVGLPLMLLLLVGAIVARVLMSQRQGPAPAQPPAAPTPAPQAPVQAPAPPAQTVVIRHEGLTQPAPQGEAPPATPQHVQAFEVLLPGSFTATLRPKE